MQFKFSNIRRMRFDQSSPVQPGSDYRGGSTNLTQTFWYPLKNETKWWSQSVEGLLSKGPTPTSFQFDEGLDQSLISESCRKTGPEHLDMVQQAQGLAATPRYGKQSLYALALNTKTHIQTPKQSTTLSHTML